MIVVVVVAVVAAVVVVVVVLVLLLLLFLVCFTLIMFSMISCAVFASISCCHNLPHE